MLLKQFNKVMFLVFIQVERLINVLVCFVFNLLQDELKLIKILFVL
ncbi:hypothetical protein BN863_20110 [Formosa agariphila KMM 3901]|uniref:Uncharacterized protein n=1 Tax=Formosa agariphila (strain DSM 15362 / KCTC 12365 / LMG 23005 / KMM 3901 / M-2Alg 35-1) TaxID=1347342 RepID=T2KMN3_FORAG|nr:hypothetical protein BN863_20110 [Formosa agariphila KMM 3901]